MDSDIISAIRSATRLRLRNRKPEEGIPSKEEVVAIVDTLIRRMREDDPSLNIDADTREAAIAAVLHDNTVKNDEFTMLVGERDNHIDWLTATRPSIEWKQWDRYRQYLLDKAGLPIDVVGMIGRVSDQILDCLENPKREGEWSLRGLVVGSVQSGKTANYAGLINKAIDAGYKFIVVVAGVHDNLRNQTQQRIDQAVTGVDSREGANTGNRYGVGTFGPGVMVHSLTSAESDFNANMLAGAIVGLGGDPVIVVVKKHATILKNLSKFARTISGTVRADGAKLKPYGEERESDNLNRWVERCPMLLIDDEADHASINTASGPDEMTAINHQLVNLLGSFRSSAYVGYTATPYANLFADDEARENLFPRNFIINIQAPDNYIGPAKVFGMEEDADAGVDAEAGLGIVRELKQQDYIVHIPEKHRTDFSPKLIPAKMRQAIRAFILASAVRVIRSRKRTMSPHNSMLIHVSRYTAVIDKFVNLIKNELDTLRVALETNSSAEIEEFKSLWESDFVPTTEKMPVYFDLPPVTWDEVSLELVHCTRKISVRAIHGTSSDILDYDRQSRDGLFVIAVGGDKLSRGLTLESLTVSFFLRTSKMYDTLMQMGRWFGYKDGYIDVCRVYTSAQLVDWYKHIALADTELRREFHRMVMLRKTPKEYGLKVRTHPQGLRITSLAKMRHSKNMQLTFANQLVQSTMLHSAGSKITDNFNIFSSFAEALGAEHKSETRGSHLLFRDVPRSKIIDFVQKMEVPAGANHFSKQPFIEFLDAQNEYAKLWTVAIAGAQSEAGNGQEYQLLGEKRKAIIRSIEKAAGDEDKILEALPEGTFSPRKHNLLDPKDEGVDLHAVILDEDLADELSEKEDIQLNEDALDESVGKPLYDVAFALTKKRPLKKNQKEHKRPRGEDFRIVRPDGTALLLIYPFTPVLGEDASGPKWANVPHPVIGFAASFPSSERVRALEYQVNQVFQKMFGLPDIDEGIDD